MPFAKRARRSAVHRSMTAMLRLSGACGYHGTLLAHNVIPAAEEVVSAMPLAM